VQEIHEIYKNKYVRVKFICYYVFGQYIIGQKCAITLSVKDFTVSGTKFIV